MAILVNLSEVEPYLPSDLTAILRNTALFDEYEQMAARLISRRSGIILPADPLSRPATLDWTVECTAAIIAWRMTPKLHNPNQDIIRLHERHYLLAMERIEERRQIPAGPSGRSLIGDIEDMY